jgi:hypothetical protein
MAPISPGLLSWVDLLAKFSQFLFSLCALLISLWAVIFKRRDLFRTELVKKQLDEVGKVRTSLQSILFDLYYIPITEQTMRVMGWNLDTLKEHDPESWEQYYRYKNTSLELFYKFSDNNYYLFPKWLSGERRQKFADAMKIFAPFTLVATASKSSSEREAYAGEINRMKEYLDDALRTHT